LLNGYLSDTFGPRRCHFLDLFWLQLENLFLGCYFCPGYCLLWLMVWQSRLEWINKRNDSLVFRKEQTGDSYVLVVLLVMFHLEAFLLPFFAFVSFDMDFLSELGWDKGGFNIPFI